jgi:hypothetical protein
MSYILVNAIPAHDGPIRCICNGLNDLEIITGCQSSAPNIRRWRISPDLLSIEEIGTPIYHDHWVTAVTSRRSTDLLQRYPLVRFVSFFSLLL